jgi:hypothetical protein
MLPSLSGEGEKNEIKKKRIKKIIPFSYVKVYYNKF